MKKILISVFMVVLFVCLSNFVVLANKQDNRWSKINDYIYIDKSSIKKSAYSVSAWFKTYSSSKYKPNKINGIDVSYEISKYEVECEGEITIAILHSKSYDKDNNLLDEYINEQGYACTYPCLINDKIYVGELCKAK